MRKTEEEILRECKTNTVPFIPNHDNQEWVSKSDAITAMQTFAQQESEGFARWLANNASPIHVRSIHSDKWEYHPTETAMPLSELYAIYLKNKF